MCTVPHVCNCGSAVVNATHEIGKDGCKRVMEESPVPFSDDFYAWKVRNVPITDYTLRHQRGYSQHGCGCWSSWNESKNSLRG